MPAPVIAAQYRARDGTEHQVLVERSPEGRWRVLDAVENDAIVVDTLTGCRSRVRDVGEGERRPTARSACRRQDRAARAPNFRTRRRKRPRPILIRSARSSCLRASAPPRRRRPPPRERGRSGGLFGSREPAGGLRRPAGAGGESELCSDRASVDGC